MKSSWFSKIFICVIIDLRLVVNKQLNQDEIFYCDGLPGGFYADTRRDCSGYFLCGEYSTLGVRFSCPPGTKFKQQSLVCDHGHQVDCVESTSGFQPIQKIVVPQNSKHESTSSFQPIQKIEVPQLNKHESIRSFQVNQKIEVPQLTKPDNFLGKPATQIFSLQKPRKSSTTSRFHGRNNLFNEIVNTEHDFSKKSVPSPHFETENLKTDFRRLKSRFQSPGWSNRKLFKGSNLVVENSVSKQRVKEPQQFENLQTEEKSSQVKIPSTILTPPQGQVVKFETQKSPKMQVVFKINENLQKPKKATRPGKDLNTKVSSVVSTPSVRMTAPPHTAQVSYFSDRKPKLINFGNIHHNLVWSNDVDSDGQTNPSISKSAKDIDIDGKTNPSISKSAKEIDSKSAKEESFGGSVVRKVNNDISADVAGRDPDVADRDDDATDQNQNIAAAQSTVRGFVVKPRGPERGFFNRDKLEQFPFFSRKTTESPPALEFGFSPIPDTTTEKSRKERQQSNQDFENYVSDKSEYFKRKISAISPLDHLQAPLPPIENSVKRSFGASAQKKKSILDFLGIFDTRRFFYIPTERQDEQEGILQMISNFISG